MTKPRYNFWKTIAYDTYSIPNAPGYALKCFNSFEEFSEYMSTEIDPSWDQTEWGKFLLSNGETKTMEDSNISMDKHRAYVDYVHSSSNMNTSNSYTYSANNYESLAKDLILNGVVDIDSLFSAIKHSKYRVIDGGISREEYYKPTRKVLAKYVSRYTDKQYKQPTKKIPAYIIASLARYYIDSGLSLREASRKLREEEGITISYERIRELVTEHCKDKLNTDE